MRARTLDQAVLMSMQELAESARKLMQGLGHMLDIEEVDVDTTPKTLVYEEDKMKVLHYHPMVERPHPLPILIAYALVNRQYMMDLQTDRSLIRNMLRMGMDLYIIDWGYPSKMDRYLTMEDYIEGYLDHAVDAVRAHSGQDRINLLGVCQGGTFSAIYTALHQDKIQNLICMVTPIDFHVQDGLLNVWAQPIDVDAVVDAFGVVPGDLLNIGFLMLKPFQLMVDKYVGLLENLDNRDVVENFLRMEKWIFDSPDQAGETYRQFLKELYQGNKLVKGELEIGGRRVDLKNITCPVLNIFGEKDHLVPPSSSRPLTELVGSKDTAILSFPVGHIGIYVSSRSQREIAPKLVQWVKEHGPEGTVPPAPDRGATKSRGRSASKRPARKRTSKAGASAARRTTAPKKRRS